MAAGSAVCWPHQRAIAQPVAPIEECNQFADSVNRNQVIMDTFEEETIALADHASEAETLDDITAAATQYVVAVEDVTASLNTLIDNLNDLALTDPALSDYRDEYVGIVTGLNEALATISNSMSTVAAADSEDALSASLEAVSTEMTVAVDQVETLATNEGDLIVQVNDYCGAE